jgi:hypothetical protein
VADEPAAEPARLLALERVVGEVVWFDDEDLRFFRAAVGPVADYPKAGAAE